jgi:hypothetical protein
VPEGGPGNTIQVAIPVEEKIPVVTATAISDDSNVVENSPSTVAVNGTDGVNAGMKNLAIAGTAGIVVGALILGPITVGAVILGGVAAYGAIEHVKHLPVDENGNKVSDGSLMSKAAIAGAGVAKSAKDVNQKYQITATAAATATKVVQKVQQTDQEYKLSEKAASAATAAANKVAEVDKKYQISSKAAEATSAAASKAKEINEKYQITDKATAAATSLFSRATAAVSKMSAPAPSSTPTATPVSNSTPNSNSTA